MTIGFKANNDGSGAIQVNGVDQATISTSGNVGIGTSSPNDRLALGDGQSVSLNASSSSETTLVRWRYGGTVQSWIGRSNSDGAFVFGNQGSERFRIASDGQQSSVIPGGSTLYPEYKCRAWVNFNGTGTVAIRAGGNVSSITDNGVGDYTVNFTTAMPDANYAAKVNGDTGGVADVAVAFTRDSLTARTTSALRIGMGNSVGGAADSTVTAVAIFR